MRSARLLSIAAAALLAAPSALAQEPKVTVDKLADGVYLFTHNAHRSLFIVTAGGVLVTDPQSPDAAKRYVQEIRKITQAPVRDIVYSHHHGDHVSGAAMFEKEPAVIVSHANARKHLTTSGSGVVPPTLTFTDAATIFLDDLEVRLIYPGPSETDSNIIVHVPARKLAFIAS